MSISLFSTPVEGRMWSRGDGEGDSIDVTIIGLERQDDTGQLFAHIIDEDAIHGCVVVTEVDFLSLTPDKVAAS